MKLFRIFLIMLLAIAVPLEGAAAVRMVEMMHTATPTMEEVSSVGGADKTCVMSMKSDDKSSNSKAPCKMGDACKICQVFPSTTPSADVNLHVFPLLTTVSRLPESFLPSHDPSGLWRPPRSI